MQPRPSRINTSFPEWCQTIGGVGMEVAGTASCAELGRRFGTSKQAWQQESRRLAEQLGLRKSARQRSAETHALLNATNYRRG